MYKFALVLAVAVVATGQRYPTDVPLRASVIAQGFGNTNVNGVIIFVQESDGVVYVQGKVTGLAPGYHGIRIYETVNVPNACNALGLLLNGGTKPFAEPRDSIRLLVDLGNIYVHEQGIAFISITDTNISLNGRNNILGRAMVITAYQIDSSGAGNPVSGTSQAVACGVIARAV